MDTEDCKLLIGNLVCWKMVALSIDSRILIRDNLLHEVEDLVCEL